MNLTFSSVLSGVLALGLTQTAKADPVLHPSEPQRLEAIINNTNSNLVGDHADPNMAWVMPPLSASAKTGKLHTIGTNVGFCAEMSDMQGSSRRIQKRIEDLVIKMADQADRRQRLQDEASNAMADAEKFAREKNMTALSDIDDRIDMIEARLSKLYEELEKCEDCAPIKTEIRDLQTEKREKASARQELAVQHANDLRTYNQKRSRAVALQQKANDATKAYEDTETMMIDAKNKVLTAYSRLGSMYGAQAPIKYASGWEENTARLRADNPGWRFEMISTSEAVVSANMITSSYLEYLTPVIAFDIGGASPKDGVLQLNSYPPVLSSNVVLNLVGTCPMLHPKTFGVEPDQNGDMQYGLTISYKFPSLYLTKVKFTYNMYRLYTKVVSSGSKGGFFRSRSWSKVEEREFFKDGFTAHWSESDPHNQISEERKLEIESNVRVELLRRMAAFVNPAGLNQYLMQNPPGIPPRGGVVIADSLDKTCSTVNVYCAGASLLLRGLDAIFGSSSSSASYLNEQNRELVEEWSRETTRMTPWVTVYSAEIKE